MNPNEQVIASLVEMGNTRESVIRALEISNNDPDAAFNILNEEIDDICEDDDDSEEKEIEERYKLVFLVRTDLGMGVGKIAAQVGHATLGAYKQSSANILAKWEETGQAKIVLQVNSL